MGIIIEIIYETLLIFQKILNPVHRYNENENK